jgi:hypothetical protein
MHIYRRLGGESAAAPTGKSFRFVRACEQARAGHEISYGYLRYTYIYIYILGSGLNGLHGSRELLICVAFSWGIYIASQQHPCKVELHV